jgi:hypothetical protein
MVDMVVDQCPLRLGHCAFNGVQLSRQIDAGPAFLDHADDAAQMPLGALQAGGDGGVACMDMKF